MRIALTTTQTQAAAPPDQIAELLESAGFHGLYFTEHTHSTPRSPGFDASYDYLFEAWDPFVAAHAAAARTSTLRVGSAVALLAQHEPIALAHRLASLDQATRGRLDVGAGAGWHEEEMRNHGVDPDHRLRHLREHVSLLKALWSGHPQTLTSEHRHWREVSVLPRPRQPGGPPILLAGTGPRAVSRVERWGDGWMPIYDPGGFDGILDRMADIRAIGAAREREVPVVLTGVPADAEVLAACARAGIIAAPTLPPSPLPVLEETVERLSRLRRRVSHP